MNEFFRKFAHQTSNWVGSPWTFLIAVLVIIVWGVSGPLFHFSDTWQLVINTGTTIVTFLMVFLIQNTQNRDAQAIHLKLDELLRAMKGARNAFVNLENMSDEELQEIQEEFARLRERNASSLLEDDLQNVEAELKVRRSKKQAKKADKRS